MPPRKNKRRFEDDDEELDRQEENSKWAQLLQGQEEQEEEEEVPKKEIFNFDFSQEHRLLNQKQPPKKEEPKIQLTPEEQEELDRLLQKQKKEKEEKERVKREKKQEKKKVAEKEKEIEQSKKETEEKEEKELEEMLTKQKGNSDAKKILIAILVVLIALGALQYQKDIYARLAKFRLSSDVNYYEVLQISSGASQQELKNQYKRLVIKYHPDKNPNCHNCPDKFNSIMTAWEVLGNPEKRKHYDQNSGFISQIPSETLQLTPDNYQWLLADSDWIWIIQVYDSTSQFCHYFAPFWEEFAKKYEGQVKMGRMDVWQQSEMKSYIPYKFQIFPGLYSMHRGHDSLCQVDYQRPMRSLQLCVEGAVQESGVTKISDWSEIPSDGKIAVILGQQVKLSSTIKLIHSRFSRYISFYQINQGGKTVKVKGKDFKFQLDTVGSKKIFTKYSSFLEGMVKQSRTGCQIHYQCREQPCLLLLEQQAFHTHQQLTPFPVYEVKDPEFGPKVEEIKNLTGLFEKFELGYYQDGKIELGYFNQLADLSPENGEVIDFVCRKEDIFTKVGKGWNYVLSLINTP